MTYEDFNYLPRGIAFDKVVRDKGFNITKNLKFDGYQGGLASMVYKCFNKNSILPTDKSASCDGVKSKIMPNQELAE